MKTITLLALSFFSLNVLCQTSNKNTTQFQDTKSDPYNVPTPNQSSLGTYGIIPVSPYTGKADISIPIYSTGQRDVKLDVKLSYDTSGLLINQLPGWTGHNWTLLAGGAITRKINGRPDEISYEGTNAGTDIFFQYYKDDVYTMTSHQYFTMSELIDNGDYYSYMNQIAEQNYYDQQDVDEYRNYQNYFSYAANIPGETSDDAPRFHDASADIFYFNFLDFSGSFFYGNDGNWKVQSAQNISVLFDVSDSTNYIESYEQTYWFPANCRNPKLIVMQPKTIKGFTLIDDYGNRYVFGGKQGLIEYSMSLTGKTIVNTTEPWTANSWMLKEVRDRYGNILYTFKYSRGDEIVQIQNSYSFTGTVAKSSNHYPRTHSSDKVYNATINAPVYLDSITVMDGTKLFFDHSEVYTSSSAWQQLYPGRSNINITNMLKSSYPRLKKQDYAPDFDTYDPYATDYELFLYSFDSCSNYISNMNLEKLKHIRIISPGTTNTPDQDNIFTFIYDFNKRMHLSSLIFHTGFGFSGSYSYDFEYDRFDSIPADYLTKKFDQWGYYNGIQYDSLSTDSTLLLNSDYSDRVDEGGSIPGVVNYNYGTMGMLKRITYPTGGYSLLDYEQNTCSKYISDNKQNTINLQADIPVGGLRIKSIGNYDNEKLTGRKSYLYNQSGNTRSSGELYSMPKFHYTWEDDEYNYSADVFNSTVPLSNSFFPSVAYSTVTEPELDGSKTVYTYSNFSTEKDRMFDASRFGQNTITPFDEFGSRQYMCGKLLSETKFDSEGDSLQNITYTYATDGTFNSSHYVSTTCYNIHNLFGKIGSRYKLFYFTPGLTSVVSRTKYGNSWVTDETTYSRQHDVLTLIDSQGQSRDVDVWNVINETKKRGDNRFKTEYSYPYLEIGINSNLVQQFCIPVTGIKHYLNGTLSDGSKTVFKLAGNYVPAFDVTFASDQNVCDTVAKYVTYSPTYRVTELIDKNNINHRYYWNAKDQLIGAVANGAINIPTNATINNIMSNNSNEIYASKPIDAMLYEYNNKGKLSKIIAGNGMSAEYLYDEYGRLSLIRDTNGKNVKRYTYNYENQPTSEMVGDLLHCNMNVYVQDITPPKYIRVGYELPYYASSAEIKIISIDAERIIDSCTLPTEIREGEKKLYIANDFWGIYDICMFVNGVKQKEVRISIPDY